MKFANEKTWSCILSDGSLHELKPNGSHLPVPYEERLDYCEAVKKARINESNRQVSLSSGTSDHLERLIHFS